MRRVGSLLVAVLALVSCGSGNAAISDTAARVLEGQVAEIRSLAVAGKPDDARAKLAELRIAASELVENGELSEARGAQIVEAAAGVEEQLGLITTTTPPPAPRDDEERDHNDKPDKEEEDE